GDLLLAAHPHTIGGRDIRESNHYITRDADAAMVHNGTVSSISTDGLKTGCDTEGLLRLHHEHGPEYVLRTVPASYSVITANAGERGVTAYRDRYGRRPLWLGVDKNGAYMLASEDRSIEIIGGRPIREVTPGEMVTVYSNHVESKQVVPQKPQLCFFEAAYLAMRPSHLWGTLRRQNVDMRRLRRDLGAQAFLEHPPMDGIDFVTHIPNAPIDAAQAYALAAGRRREELFYKLNSDRAFMHPSITERQAAINTNLFVNPDMYPGKHGARFVAIDDSVVRGGNSPEAARKARARGFEMKQLVLYTPMIGGYEDGMALGCEHGIDMPPSDNFVTRRAGRNPAAIAKELGIERVDFLSVDGLVSVFERYGITRDNLCITCVAAKN
ncbi:MAG: hypothetical protein HY365_02570, partial [Candidatus Aenigmarchaeota archaeon]|nr:hypothetical protein [Candidatus Aenigmarchaeota archaeon]